MYSPYDDPWFESDLYLGDTGNYPSSSSSSLSRLKEVREAGERLHFLTRQVSELEDIIREQGAALSEKDALHKVLRCQLKELKDIKEKQIHELLTSVRRLEEKNQQLDLQVREKDDSLNECRSKLLSLDRVVAHSIPSFEKLIDKLKKACLVNHGDIRSEDDNFIQRHLLSNEFCLQQTAHDTRDSGNPSSASDSYPITSDELECIKRRLSNDVTSMLRSSVSRSSAARDLDANCFVSRIHRSHGYTGKNQLERTNEAVTSISNELMSISSPKYVNQMSSAGVSPAFTPTAGRRRIQQPSKLLLSSSSMASSYTSDVPSYNLLEDKIADDNEVNMLLMMTRNSDHNVSSKVDEDEPPEPAPPPATNSSNDNLPCLQAPRRFLPLLDSRYE